jgi:membrane associated rhomboid family serine protease
VRWGLIPYELTHPGKHCELVAGGQVACEGQPGVVGHAAPQPSTWLTVLTSIFMHGSLLHIAGNMLFLWIFGNNIEDSMARWRFVLFYLLGGLVANMAQVAVGPNSTAPGIGASGAIAAVLGGYALLYPRARVITAVILIFFITLLDLPALLVLGGWFLLQILDAAVNNPLGGSGVAYFAHIGGFIFGLLLIKLFADRVNRDYDRVNRLPVY